MTETGVVLLYIQHRATGGSQTPHKNLPVFPQVFTRPPLLLPYRFLNPLGMFTAVAVVSAVFLGSVWAGENRAIINNFKRQNPTAFVVVVMIASYFLISMLGSVMVFMSAITLPLACKLVKVFLIIASFSL